MERKKKKEFERKEGRKEGGEKKKKRKKEREKDGTSLTNERGEGDGEVRGRKRKGEAQSLRRKYRIKPRVIQETLYDRTETSSLVCLAKKKKEMAAKKAESYILYSWTIIIKIYIYISVSPNRRIENAKPLFRAAKNP